VVNNSIYERIENKGQNDALEIKRIGAEKAKQIEVSTLETAEKDIEKILLKVKSKGEVLLKTKKTEFLQKAKQRSLLKKKELINTVFQEALDKLNSLKDEDLVKLVEKLILADNIVGNEIVKVNNDDYPRYLKLFSSGKLVNGLISLDKLNLKLKDQKYQLRLSNENVNIKGGFIIIGDAYDIDHSYETILSTINDKYETELASMMFKEIGS
jgi:vacuolar-type H+-ATPase subunit E/Vma4